MKETEFDEKCKEWYVGLNYLDPFRYTTFNPRKAFKIFKSLDEEGYFYSKVVLGCLFLKGLGCECDKDKSKEYFSEVKELGNEEINRFIDLVIQEDAKGELYKQLSELSKNILSNTEYMVSSVPPDNGGDFS